MKLPAPSGTLKPNSRSFLPATADPVVALKGLDYVFTNGTRALEDVNFEVSKGSRVLLIGSNGAGKSTLLQILGEQTIGPYLQAA